MTSPAAFQATFSDWRLIKGRKVVQVVFEIPLEMADQAYQALGGMPDPGKSVWCAVARLQESARFADMARPEGPVDSGSHTCVATGANSKERRPFSSLPLPLQAALLCTDPVFHAFLNEEHNYKCEDETSAAEALREKCGVQSRSQIQLRTAAAELFLQLREEFQAWKLVSA